MLHLQIGGRKSRYQTDFTAELGGGAVNGGKDVSLLSLSKRIMSVRETKLENVPEEET